MEFEWDEAKNQSNIQKHGYSFEDAKLFFEGNTTVTESNRGTEKRFLSIGKIKEETVTVIYTQRAHKVRIISIRSARREEKRKYCELYL